MLSAAALTPAMRDVLDRMTRIRTKPGVLPLHQLPPKLARQRYATGADVLEVAPPQLGCVQDLSFPNRHGQSLALRLYAPASHKALPVLLFFHGGGFCVGSIQTHDILCRELSSRSGAAVLSVDYRLAPEHPFPAAFDDAWDALQWLMANSSQLRVDASCLAVGGDSAGGTIAASLAHLARDAGIALALQLLVYPGTSGGTDAQRFASHGTYGQGYLLDTALIDGLFDHTLAYAERHHGLFAPLNAANHESLAPCWMALAECDPLCDEGLAYGDVLRMAGVAMHLEMYRGVTHEFIKMGRVLPEARRFHHDAATALMRAFRPS